MKNKVVVVRFRPAGKRYYFDPKNLEFSVGDKVVVETVRGVELGEVIEPERHVPQEDLNASLKPIIRKATKKDLDKDARHREEIPQVLSLSKKYVEKHNLGMKLLDAEYTLDRAKLIIYFNAEGRIDFRELVKDLANEFRLRIELRQVGARDGAKFLGGIGPCGLLLCCNTFLGEFETVSIKMAKNQNLSLNPSNISGLCGKLLCCIRYEDDTYVDHRDGMPKMHSRVETKDGKGKVIAKNILERSVKVELESGGQHHYVVDELLRIDEYDPLDHVNNKNGNNNRHDEKSENG